MVATLVGDGEEVVFLADDVVFKLAHGLEVVAGDFGERLGSLAQDVLRGVLQRLAFVVIVGAEERQGGDFRERVQESGGETRDDVEVAGTGVDESREDVGTVDALAVGEDLLEILAAVQHETEGLDAPVTGHIMEVDHRDVVLLDVLDHVRLGELLRTFLEIIHERVEAHRDVVFHTIGYFFGGLKLLFYTGAKIHFFAVF